MLIKGAMTVIRKQCEFLGMNIEQLIEFADRAPLAQPEALLRAVKVYKRENNLK
jgi:hypothetical protein|tara:strand:+ start:619 stop:780 length:162 start_codon:yes stop_codon:yes gene_type:complete